MRDADNDRLYSFELTEQLLSGSQVEAWKEIAAKTLAEGGDEAERMPLDPLKGNPSLSWNMEEMKATLLGKLATAPDMWHFHYLQSSVVPRRRSK